MSASALHGGPGAGGGQAAQRTLKSASLAGPAGGPLKFLGFLVAALVLALAPATAQATVVDAGASGSCDGPAGGSDDARLRVDTAQPSAPSATLPTGTGTAAGFTQLAMGLAADADPLTGNWCPGSRRDWIEADAGVDGDRVQLCWDGTLRYDVGCPTSA